MDEQYFTDSQPASADELHLLRDHVRGFDLEMWVSDRVFSGGRIDLGTRQLIAEAPALPRVEPSLIWDAAGAPLQSRWLWSLPRRVCGQLTLTLVQSI